MPLKILLLTHAFNGLAQRLFVDLRAAGHRVSVELDIADSVTEEAVARFDPDVVLAPFLKRRISEPVWSTRLCLVLHPGPPGDRGPSSLDRALLEGRRRWAVTLLQANGDFDAGPVIAWQAFDVPPGITKAGLYRQVFTPVAAQVVARALAGLTAPPNRSPVQATASVDTTCAEDFGALGWRPVLPLAERAIDWAVHDLRQVLARVRSADGAPGAQARLFGEICRIFDGHEATPEEAERVRRVRPGEAAARRGPAVLVPTREGAALWIGHVRRAPADDGTPALKLAVTRAFAAQVQALPEWPVPLLRDEATWDELRYEAFGCAAARVGWLAFDFHNGALSERQAGRLVEALRWARGRDTRVLVLAGGTDFFCNGIHLHEIEACSQTPGDSAADASWRHIQAIDDVALEILQITDRLVVSTLRGNAAAGGCFLALAADQVWARDGVVLNPHYKNMGNLYGSEYWTYLLPRRVGAAGAQAIMQGRLPMGVEEASRRGLVDRILPAAPAAFDAACRDAAARLAADPGLAAQVQAKRERRAADEAHKPLATYRAEELQRMHRNFYGFDPSYHVARHHFVHRKPHAWTPRHLAIHR